MPAITDFFGVDRAAGAMAATATAVLVVPMLAPTLGGFTVEWIGWRAAFGLAVLLGAVVLHFTLARTTETHAATEAAGPSPRTLTSYARLLRSPEYLSYVAIDVMGVRPSSYGMLFFLPAFASFAGFFFTSRMAHRLGGWRMMRMGTVTAFVGAVALLGLSLAGVWHPAALFLPGMLVCGANALSAPNSPAGAISAMRDVAGAASGLLGFLQLLTGAVATQLVAVLADATPYPLAYAIATLNLCALAMLVHIGRRRRIGVVA